MLVGKIVLQVSKLFLLQEAELEEWYMHSFDVIYISFDDSYFTCSF